MADEVRGDEDGDGGFGPLGAIAESVHAECTPRDQVCESACCVVEAESVGGPSCVSCQPIKAGLVVVVVVVVSFFAVVVGIVVASTISTIALRDSMLEEGSRPRWKKYTSAYGASVMVLKPSGDAVRADEVVAC